MSLNRLKHRFLQSDGLPLRELLITPFVIQIIAAVTLVGALSFRNGQRAVNDLASQLQSEITARITQQLQGYVAIPHNINKINANAFAQGDVDVLTTTGEHLFWQQAKIFPNTNLIYCGAEQDGSFLGVGRNVDDRSLEMVIYNESTQRVGHYYSLDNQGNEQRLLRAGSKPYDARVRPWYQAALGANGPTWSDIYLDFDTLLPTITASLPVYDLSGNQVIGVCATDFILPEEMSQFLKTLEIGKTGATFIVDRSGELISTSFEEDLLTGRGSTLRRITADESKNALVQGTATHLMETFGMLDNIQEPQQLSFHVNGQRQYVEIRPFNDTQGLDWLIVVVIPEADFMAQIHANARDTVLLCMAALAIATLLGIATAERITRPVVELNQAAQDLANGNLKRNVGVSGIRELKTLGQSFNSMAQQLHHSFEALETKNQDVTAAKEELAQAKEQLEAVLNAVPGPIAWINVDGTYIGVNQVLAEHWNITPDTFIGKPVGFMEPTSTLTQFMQQFLSGPELATSQVFDVDRNKARTSYLIAAQKYQRGTAAVFVGIDITDRRRAEESLRQSEATNRALIQSIPDLLIRMKGDGTYLDILSSERLSVHDQVRFRVGTSVYDSLPQENADLRMHYVRKALDTQSMQVYEQRLRVDTSTQDEEVRIIVIGEDEVLIIVRDITKRKQAEEALRIAEENYRSIFENALEGIFQSTPHGRFLSVNPAMADMYGYDCPADMVESVQNIGTQIFAHLGDRDEFLTQMATANEVKEFEYQARCKNGRIIWVQESTRAVQDDSGTLLYYEGIVQDITLRKLQEKDLIRQLQELQIEIDHKKREREVSQITQSDYFQEVRETVERIRLDDFWS
ncbi:MAG: PAS domain S-box protein [Leptolyngbyaceae bacterium]|nr:PAS domain S-box protein [Leptolyngbyaceae bacterium]